MCGCQATSRLKEHLNHSGARTGYCGWTNPGRASCRTADKGTWDVDLHHIGSMADCVAKHASRPSELEPTQPSVAVYRSDSRPACLVSRCRGCANCRYVSLSLAPPHRDCSWYKACDLSKLHPAPRTGPDYASVPVLK